MSLSFSQNTSYRFGSVSPNFQSAVSRPALVVRTDHSSQTAVYWGEASKQNGRSAYSCSPLSFRSSELSYRSVETGGGRTFRTSDYYLRSSGSTFLDAHGEVMKLIDFKPVVFDISRPTDTPPTGELHPEEVIVPVGDVLLPMLLMTGIYAVIRYFRNRRKFSAV